MRTPNMALLIATVVSWCYPVAMVASFYATYLVAWVELGYAPRPWIDCPSSIGVWVGVFRYVPGVLLMGIPVGAMAGLVLTVFFVVRRYHWAWAPLAVVALCWLWIAAFAFLRWDPGRVGDWYTD